jgi:hypothetical protein
MIHMWITRTALCLPVQNCYESASLKRPHPVVRRSRSALTSRVPTAAMAVVDSVDGDIFNRERSNVVINVALDQPHLPVALGIAWSVDFASEFIPSSLPWVFPTAFIELRVENTGVEAVLIYHYRPGAIVTVHGSNAVGANLEQVSANETGSSAMDRSKAKPTKETMAWPVGITHFETPQRKASAFHLIPPLALHPVTLIGSIVESVDHNEVTHSRQQTSNYGLLL